MKRLTKLQAGYIAGIIDGEGNIDIQKGSSPRIRIAQVDKRLCDWLLLTIGEGYINKIERSKKNPKWQDVYIFQLSGWYDCLKLTLQIYPLLIVKKEQADRVFGNKLSSKYTRLLKLYKSGAEKRWEKYLSKQPQIPWNKDKKYTPEQHDAVANGIKKYWEGMMPEPRWYGKPENKPDWSNNNLKNK